MKELDWKKIVAILLMALAAGMGGGSITAPFCAPNCDCESRGYFVAESCKCCQGGSERCEVQCHDAVPGSRQLCECGCTGGVIWKLPAVTYHTKIKP